MLSLCGWHRRKKVSKKIVKHPGGRPTKYESGVFKKIEEYISMSGKEQMSLPSIEGLADYLDVTSETIRQWAKKYPEFSLTIKKIADKQKKQLMDDGMYGGKEVNAAMAIFLLKVNHGMKDGSQNSNQINIGKVYIELPKRKFREEEIVEAVAETTASS